MINIEGNQYKAEEGYLIIRINDNYLMGEDIFIGENDSINNYVEQKATLEQLQTLRRYKPNYLEDEQNN